MASPGCSLRGFVLSVCKVCPQRVQVNFPAPPRSSEKRWPLPAQSCRAIAISTSCQHESARDSARLTMRPPSMSIDAEPSVWGLISCAAMALSRMCGCIMSLARVAPNVLHSGSFVLLGRLFPEWFAPFFSHHRDGRPATRPVHEVEQPAWHGLGRQSNRTKGGLADNGESRRRNPGRPHHTEPVRRLA